MKVRDSIGGKMRRIILLTTGVVLMLTVTTFLVYEIFAFRRTHLEKISTVAQIAADNLTSSLGFQSQADAAEIMNTLQAEPTIELAVVYDEHGKVFAVYPANAPLESVPRNPGENRGRYEEGALVIVKPSVEKGVIKGRLYVRAGLEPLYERLRLYGGLIALVLAILLLIVGVVADRRRSSPQSVPAAA